MPASKIILDVVYNHTAEGNELGPTLSFRGIDNTSYYWLMPGEPRYYDDFTGCGNALNLTHPRVLQMVMDSLRYWVEVCHVDGFRFDLATTLGRTPTGFDRGVGVLRGHPAGSGAGPGQADRRALGRRARAATRSAAFRPAGRNGTTSSAGRCAVSGPATASLLGELGRRMTGSADMFSARRPKPARQHQPRHGA